MEDVESQTPPKKTVQDRDSGTLQESLETPKKVESNCQQFVFCSERVFQAEAIRTTVMPLTPLICTTVMRIVSASGIGYVHNRSMRFYDKLTHALNYIYIEL